MSDPRQPTFLDDFKIQIYMPHRAFTPLIQRTFTTEVEHLYSSIYIHGDLCSRSTIFNGELQPIFIVFNRPPDSVIKLDELCQRIQFRVEQPYHSFQQSGTHVTPLFDYSKMKYEVGDNWVIFCKIIKINLGQNLINQDINLNVSVEYEGSQQGKTIYRDMLNSHLMEQNQAKFISHLSKQVRFQNALDLDWQADDQGLDGKIISYKVLKVKQIYILKIRINTELQTTNPKIIEILEDLHAVYKIPNQSKLKIQNIDFLTLFSTQNIPQLQDGVSIRRNYFDESNNGGFIELQIDYQDSSIVQWQIENELSTTTSQFMVEYEHQSSATIGAKVSEVTRFKKDGDEYLALRLQIVNHLSIPQDLVMINDPEVFGYRFNKTDNQLRQVIGVCLVTSTALGVLNPHQTVEAIFRVRLIHRGILFLPKINFTGSMADTQVVNLNFLHSYET